MPAAIRPSAGFGAAVTCSATLSWRAVKLGDDSSSSAAPPLTIAAAMLVPLICLNALVPLPATRSAG